MEVVEIRTPHVGGQVRYYQYDSSDGLNLVASTQDYTSHTLNSRNLDKVTVGDFDGDGIPELVVQDESQEMLYGLQRTFCGVNVAWNVSLVPSSKLETTNIAVSCNTESNAMNILFATPETLTRLEFVANKEGNTSGLGAFAACGESGASTTPSSAFLWMTALSITLTRWILR